ncbi:MAG TPA: hypothetical protein VIY54_13595 [Steroidobacteraceae bacterium]
MSTERHYWFVAREHGFGWWPSCWQGWLTIGAYFLLVAVAPRLFSLDGNELDRCRFVAFVTGAVLIICRLKAEPARYRWGGQ